MQRTIDATYKRCNTELYNAQKMQERKMQQRNMQNTKDATQNMQRTKDATKIYTTKDATHKMHTTLRCISSFAGRYLYFTCMRPMFGVLCGSVLSHSPTPFVSNEILKLQMQLRMQN